MVQLIVGEKGKGKSKHLLDKVNTEVKNISGNIVYLDTSAKHMYELNNKVRLINVSDYMVDNSDEFIGFICGILSQDHDLQQMYFDNFLKICSVDVCSITDVVAKLEKIGEAFNIDFVISVGMNESELPQELVSKIIISL